MTDDIAVVETVYAHFNARNIDGVLDALADDVDWAHAMDGGYVHGHSGVREYWTRQWAIVSPHVEPVNFTSAADGSVVVTVIQTIRDLDGNPLHEQTHGLKDTTVRHVFTLRGGKVTRFEVPDDV